MRLLAEHDEINARWLDYELDVGKVIAFPAMSGIPDASAIPPSPMRNASALPVHSNYLTVAVDESATQPERQAAYRRVREALDGLILLSDDAVDALEQRVAGELDG